MEQQNNSSPKARIQTVRLIDLARIIAKRFRMICFVTLSAAVVSLIYSLTLSNIYTAKTLILPKPEDKGLKSALLGQLGGLENLVGGAVEGSNAAELYVSMLKSEVLRDRIIDRFKLLEIFNKKYRAEVYRTLDKKVSVSASKKDGIVTLTVDDKDPKRAANIANAFTEELERLAVRLNVAGAGQNRAFLEQRLSSAKAALAKAEDDLKEFQGKHKAVNVTEQSKATIEGVAQLRAKLAAFEVELATVRRQYTDTNWRVKNLATTVASMRAQVAKLEGTDGDSAIPSVGTMPALGKEYVRRMREFKIQEALVEQLTKQFELASLNEAKDIAPFQVMQLAEVPEMKSKPSRLKIVAAASSFALLVSILMCFVLENITRMPEQERVQWHELRKYLSIRKRE